MFLDKHVLIVIRLSYSNLWYLLKLGYIHKQAVLLFKNTDQLIILNYYTNQQYKPNVSTMGCYSPDLSLVTRYRSYSTNI